MSSGNNHTNHTAEGAHGKQCGNMMAYRHRQVEDDINNEAEEGEVKKTRANRHHQKKHGIANVGNAKQESTAKVESTSRDYVHGFENVASGSVDTDFSMTVEQWFQHMMEGGPKYLYQVSESIRIIQDVMLELKQFDQYVLSLS